MAFESPSRGSTPGSVSPGMVDPAEVVPEEHDLAHEIGELHHQFPRDSADRLAQRIRLANPTWDVEEERVAQLMEDLDLTKGKQDKEEGDEEDELSRQESCDSGTSRASSSSSSRSWLGAFEAIRHELRDAWSDFDLDAHPTEIGTRHRYDPATKQWTHDQVYLKMEKEPFAAGSMRQCFRMKKLSTFVSQQWKRASNYVAKRYLKHTERDTYFNDVKLQMDCKLWGERYNQCSPPKQVDVIQTYIIELSDREGSPVFAIEHLIEGDYLKYNSNSGFVTDEQLRFTPQTFSHFTFEKSDHQLIVVDVQGVGDLYTDPQIHTATGTHYGEGDLGPKGMALFFQSHRCNPLCRLLKLNPFDLHDSELELQPSHVAQGATVVRSPERRVSVASNSSPQRAFGLARVAVAPVIHTSAAAECAGEPAFELPPRPEYDPAVANLGLVHFCLAEYNATGQTLGDVHEPNADACLYHAELAACMGVVPAMEALARIFSGLHSETFPDVEAPEDNVMASRMRQLAAEHRHRESMIFMAEQKLSGEKPCSAEALAWLALASTIPKDPAAFSQPECYQLLARMAEIYSQGGQGLEANSKRAFELYEQAAEAALELGKGKASAKLYEQAAMLDCD